MGRRMESGGGRREAVCHLASAGTSSGPFRGSFCPAKPGLCLTTCTLGWGNLNVPQSPCHCVSMIFNHRSGHCLHEHVWMEGPMGKGGWREAFVRCFLFFTFRTTSTIKKKVLIDRRVVQNPDRKGSNGVHGVPNKCQDCIK